MLRWRPRNGNAHRAHLTLARRFLLVVVLAATGTWSYVPGTDHGPTGVTGRSAPADFYLPGTDAGALISSLDYKTFAPVGAGTTVTIPKGQALRLLMNDARGDQGATGFDDNTGELAVQWTVESCQ